MLHARSTHWTVAKWARQWMQMTDRGFISQPTILINNKKIVLNLKLRAQYHILTHRIEFVRIGNRGAVCHGVMIQTELSKTNNNKNKTKQNRKINFSFLVFLSKNFETTHIKKNATYNASIFLLINFVNFKQFEWTQIKSRPNNDDAHWNVDHSSIRRRQRLRRRRFQHNHRRSCLNENVNIQHACTHTCTGSMFSFTRTKAYQFTCRCNNCRQVRQCSYLRWYYVM